MPLQQVVWHLGALRTAGHAVHVNRLLPKRKHNRARNRLRFVFRNQWLRKPGLRKACPQIQIVGRRPDGEAIALRGLLVHLIKYWQLVRGGRVHLHTVALRQPDVVAGFGLECFQQLFQWLLHVQHNCVAKLNLAGRLFPATAQQHIGCGRIRNQQRRIDFDEDCAGALGVRAQVCKHRLCERNAAPVQQRPARHVVNGSSQPEGARIALQYLRTRHWARVFSPEQAPRSPAVARFKVTPLPCLQQRRRRIKLQQASMPVRLRLGVAQRVLRCGNAQSIAPNSAGRRVALCEPEIGAIQTVRPRHIHMVPRATVAF